MNAQEQMIEYAKSKMFAMNAKSTLTPEQWCGKMIAEGIVISRQGGDMVVAHASRNGKTITITETTKAEKPKVIDGKLEIVTVETSVEVMKISL